MSSPDSFFDAAFPARPGAHALHPHPLCGGALWSAWALHRWASAATCPGRRGARLGLSGRILEGGVDWQIARADGVLEIDAHYVIEARTAPASRCSQGLRHGRRGDGRPRGGETYRPATTSSAWCASPLARRPGRT